MKVRLVVLVLAIAGALGGAVSHRAPSYAASAPGDVAGVATTNEPGVASQVQGGGWWDWDGTDKT
jgi:hypothetical protein